MVDRAFYDEVCELFSRAGGVYTSIRPQFYTYLIECLELGQFYVERDETGKIIAFANYWWIDPSEQHVALIYERPRDIVCGKSSWVVDFVNHGGRKVITNLAKHLRAAAPAGASGIAWDHRSRMDLRYFPSQKGDSHGA